MADSALNLPPYQVTPREEEDDFEMCAHCDHYVLFEDSIECEFCDKTLCLSHMEPNEHDCLEYLELANGK